MVTSPRRVAGPHGSKGKKDKGQMSGTERDGRRLSAAGQRGLLQPGIRSSRAACNVATV
jgi:hypothetical protein